MMLMMKKSLNIQIPRRQRCKKRRDTKSNNIIQLMTLPTPQAHDQFLKLLAYILPP
jgi:hypothetical protein